MRYVKDTYIGSIKYAIEPIAYPSGCYREREDYRSRILQIDDFDPYSEFKHIRLNKTREGKWKLKPSYKHHGNSVRWGDKWWDDDCLLYNDKPYYGIVEKFKDIYIVAVVTYSITRRGVTRSDYRVATTNFYIYTAMNTNHNAILDYKRVLSLTEKEAINGYRKLDSVDWMIDDLKSKSVSFSDQTGSVDASKLLMLMSTMMENQLENQANSQTEIFIPGIDHETFKRIVRLIIANDLYELCKYHSSLDYLDSAWLAVLIDKIHKDYHIERS